MSAPPVRAAPARLDEPAAAGDPRAARPPVRRRRAGLRRARPAGRGRCRRRARARARQGALGRGAGGRPARARRRHGGRARRPGLRQAARTRPRPSRCSRRSPGETHVVVSGLCLLTPGWEVVEHEETRVTFRELTPRELAAPHGARRVGGTGGRVCDPGPRRRARRADRGRLPERRRPPRARCSSACWPSASRARTASDSATEGRHARLDSCARVWASFAH